MKVYVFLSEWTIDSTDESTIEVYETEEQAKERLNAERKNAEEYFGEWDDDDIERETEINEFSIWVSGCYSENHINVSVIEREVISEKNKNK